jgi:hypothetical protein
MVIGGLHLQEAGISKVYTIEPPPLSWERGTRGGEAIKKRLPFSGSLFIFISTSS